GFRGDMRQIAGTFAQLEKARLVAKLRGARDRKRAATGKCEGRKSLAERDPELVRQAKRLRRRSPKGRQRSLREISAELAELGHLNAGGNPFSPSSVKSMPDGRPRAAKQRRSWGRRARESGRGHGPGRSGRSTPQPPRRFFGYAKV